MENEVARLQHTLEELERNLTTKKEALKKWVGDGGDQTGGRVSTAVREAAAVRYLQSQSMNISTELNKIAIPF